ncbi:MAG: LacI family DNA-binding transcriptional regulator [Lachnospiraceae bacterium]|nr:LacI family DNA-binding transcriptional regulator [Lachnospiraceae bacterium]MDD3615496.1 LacI family DNA-binding transcriptional regulator [Lachnospiraceae bacterium]
MKAKDLAELLGVSTATISLVLNGKPGISDTMRKSVLKKIRDLGYEDMIKSDAPNEEESQEAHNKVIGFVLFKDGGELLGMNSFFPLILDGIENRARIHGYNLAIINIEKNNIKNEIHYIQDSRCDGFVIFATEMQRESLMPFEKLKIPFVLLDNHFYEKRINTIEVDNELGTFLAVKHLYELGHRKVGYISSGLNINSFKEREFWAKQAMRNMGMEDPEQFSLTTGYPQDKSEQVMDDLIRQGKTNATAYLTDNDIVAIGVVRALSKRGVRVPDDVSVIGYDDRPVCELIEPKLTTVRLPRTDFGAEAVSRLIRQIDGRTTCVTRTKIECSLVERKSTKKVRK